MGKLFICFIAVAALFTQAYSQISWEKHDDPVLPRGASGEWDSQFLAGPYVIYHGNNYHMWHSGYDGGNDGSSIGYARSSDGIAWTKDGLNNPVLESGPPGSWDAVTVYQPSVFFDGTTYHMWFGGHNLTTVQTQIGYATSPDSINWTKYSNNPVLTPGPEGTWDDETVGSPNVLFIDGVFHMWYGGGDGTIAQIGHATSPDGMTWTKDTLNPVLKVGTTGRWDEAAVIEPSVLYDGETTYHMWYSGGGSFLWRIGYASSSDGLNWDKHPNPVLEPGSSGSWDDTFVGLCVVTFNSADSTNFKMWYGGGVGFVIGDIGYASTTGPVSVGDDKSVELPRRFSLLPNYPNPFNPSTTIKFDLPTSTEVRLSVYDFLGREVSLLLNERREAGTHELRFDGSGLSSGVYFYRLTAGEYVETKRAVLVR
jgi:predicted GH43/DUF377 family glycosyl hydrolase